VKKLISAFLLLAALLWLGPTQHVVAQQLTAQQSQDPQSVTVYITKTGKKYHKDGCRYLAASKIKTTLKEAKANGYTPCKVCHPPA
jgi:biopolymer transport protein ExbD